MMVVVVGVVWHRRVGGNTEAWGHASGGSGLPARRMGSQVEFARLPVAEGDGAGDFLESSHAVVRVRIDQEPSPKKLGNSGGVNAQDHRESSSGAGYGHAAEICADQVRTCLGGAGGASWSEEELQQLLP